MGCGPHRRASPVELGAGVGAAMGTFRKLRVTEAHLDALVAAGASAPQVVAFVKLAIASEQDGLDRQRKADRERQARRRRGLKTAMSRGHTRDIADMPSSSPQSYSDSSAIGVPTDEFEAREDVDRAFAEFIDLAARAGLPSPRVLSKSRSMLLRTIIQRHGLDAWRCALAKLDASAFCRGQNERGWKAGIDFLLKPEKFQNLIDGKYDRWSNALPTESRQAESPTTASIFLAIAKKARDSNAH